MNKENTKEFLSRPLHMYNKESLVVSDHESSEQTQLPEQSTEAPQEDKATEFETPFKTLHINGIWVSSEKNIKETHFKTIINSTWGTREQHIQKLTLFKTPVHILDRDLVKNRSRETSFKTMGKSGRENIASQDTVIEDLIPFKTPNIKYRTSRVHFKTFDDWVKARKMKCDMVLKDVSSFVSDKMEEDRLRAPSCRQPNSWQTKRNSDPQWSRTSPIDREEISMGDYHNRGEFTMEQNSVPQATEVRGGKQWPERERFEAKLSWQHSLQECFIVKEAKKLKSDRNDSFQDPRPRQRRRVTGRDTKHAVANRATD